MRARVLIVGGGVMGASIALHAARGTEPVDAPVVLLERRELGAGSSGRSGAILRQFYGDDELISMARDSLRAYAAFELVTGRPIGFTRCGVLTLASAAQEGPLALLERNFARMRACGVEVERLDARAIRELWPGIEVADDAVGAWEPTSGYVDPMSTVEAFAVTARSYGATTRCGVEALSIEVERGRVVAVETSAGRYEPELVVVAAGPWTARLLARAKIELPLRAIRPEQHFLEMPSPLAMPATRRSFAAPESLDVGLDRRFARDPEPPPAHPVLLDLELGYYTRCEPRLARTRIGALDYSRDRELDDPDALDEEVGPEFPRWARAQLERRVPEYREQPDRGSQAAWYTLTPDAQAVIGPCPGFENLLVASGFSGHGFKLAPSVGEGVAQLLRGERVTAFSREFFDPARFGRGVTSWSGRFGL